MQTMPVSEPRNHYAAVGEAVATGGPVFLAKTVPWRVRGPKGGGGPWTSRSEE